MGETLFKALFVVFVLATYVMRWPEVKQRRTRKTQESRITFWESVFAILAWFGIVVVPFIFVFSPWLDYANYQRPAVIGWMGVAVSIGALALLWRAHSDLGKSWSATLQIQAGQKLVTTGIYGSIRHPIYAAHWLWGLAQVLMLANWIAGPSGLVLFLFTYLYRVPREEQMMIDTFGDEYRTYMKRTGRVIPRLSQQ